MRGSSLKSPSQNRMCPIKAYGSSISHSPNKHFLNATYCPSLPSSVITAFFGTMDESDSSMVFVCTHHCIDRYSLLSHVQNHPGLPGMSNITISGMPCSRTPVCFHSLALATIPCWWPEEVADPPTQSIILTKLNHFTLTHYGVPVPCPTLKHHC